MKRWPNKLPKFYHYTKMQQSSKLYEPSLFEKPTYRALLQVLFETLSSLLGF
jgi:hypothetical protein